MRNAAAIATLSLAVFSLVYLITRGQAARPDELASLVAALGAASALVFVIVERRATRPMFDFAAFRNCGFAGAFIGSAAMNLSFWPFVIHLPIYVQAVLGYDGVTAGLAILADTLPTLVAHRWGDASATCPSGAKLRYGGTRRPDRAVPGLSAMAYWLFKSEPATWSWDQQVAAGAAGTFWNGVRNHLAKKQLMAMEVGERGFFYHSNDGKAVVGVVEVIRPYYPDHTDETGRFGMVDVRAVQALPRPVTLEAIKADPALAGMVLVNNSRLSVQPVTETGWDRVCALGGL